MMGREISEEEVQKAIETFDADGNGVIDFEEFKLLMFQADASTQAQIEMEELEDAFCSFIRTTDIKELQFAKMDPKKYKQVRRRLCETATISKHEMRHLFCNLGQKLSDEEFDYMMRDVDKDGNGRVDFAEFKSLMTGIPL